VHPGLRPYPALRFAPDIGLHAKGRELARALALRLRIFRVEQSLTRQELAELTGLSASAIKRVERTGAIGLERFLLLALQLGLEEDLTDLFAFRRHGVPSLVLASRAMHRKNGRRDRRRRAKERVGA
jgi:transcriptional regulator with XRE-family HTH domain